MNSEVIESKYDEWFNAWANGMNMEESDIGQRMGTVCVKQHWWRAEGGNC